MHIDWWTLALQTVNVLILIWILGRFFFRPVADLVARRKQATEKLLAEADAARRETSEIRTEASRLRANLDAERERLVAEARKSAESEKAALIAQSSTELEQRRSEAAAAIERERARAQEALVDHASELSIEIARRLLARIPGAAAFSTFLDGLVSELRDLPAEQRESLLEADAGHPLEVATAAALSEGQDTELRNAIRAALGADPPLHISVDPSLIAGLEIRARNLVLRNNWQADLGRIHRELDSDRHA